MLNVTCIKIHSIILSVTCHGLRNFPLLIHIPSQPFVNFRNPMSLLFSELVTHVGVGWGGHEGVGWVMKGWGWGGS